MNMHSSMFLLRNSFEESSEEASELILDPLDPGVRQDIHSISSLLKLYCRELPNPLCTFTLYPRFLAAAAVAEEYRPAAMRQVVRKLPDEHFRWERHRFYVWISWKCRYFSTHLLDDEFSYNWYASTQQFTFGTDFAHPNAWAVWLLVRDAGLCHSTRDSKKERERKKKDDNSQALGGSDTVSTCLSTIETTEKCCRVFDSHFLSFLITPIHWKCPLCYSILLELV